MSRLSAIRLERAALRLDIASTRAQAVKSGAELRATISAVARGVAIARLAMSALRILLRKRAGETVRD